MHEPTQKSQACTEMTVYHMSARGNLGSAHEACSCKQARMDCGSSTGVRQFVRSGADCPISGDKDPSNKPRTNDHRENLRVTLKPGHLISTLAFACHTQTPA